MKRCNVRSRSPWPDDICACPHIQSSDLPERRISRLSLVVIGILDRLRLQTWITDFLDLAEVAGCQTDNSTLYNPVHQSSTLDSVSSNNIHTSLQKMICKFIIAYIKSSFSNEATFTQLLSFFQPMLTSYFGFMVQFNYGWVLKKCVVSYMCWTFPMSGISITDFWTVHH